MDSSTAFYDIIFDVEPDGTIDLNDLEMDVFEQLEDILDDPAQVSRLVPALPAAVADLLQLLGRDDCDFSALDKVIGRDIELTVEVVRMANSPYYLRSLSEIESLEQAVRCIGLDAVGTIASKVLMSRVLQVRPLYFKWFGEIIWRHSRQTAAACAYLSQNPNVFPCYFLGLIHDVGKIVVFDCLVEAFSRASDHEVPSSKLFKQLMIERAASLSVVIARQWQLPQQMVEALEQQGEGRHSDERQGESLYRANRASELWLAMDAGQMQREQVEEELQQIDLSETQISELLAVFETVT